MSSTKDNWQFFGIFVVLLLIVGSIGYGGYRIKRWWHWEYSYKDKVEEATTGRAAADSPAVPS